MCSLENSKVLNKNNEKIKHQKTFDLLAQELVARYTSLKLLNIGFGFTI